MKNFDPEELERTRTRNPALTDEAIEAMVEDIRGKLEGTLAHAGDFELGNAHGGMRTYQTVMPMRPEPFIALGEFCRQVEEEIKQRLAHRAAREILVTVTDLERAHLEASAAEDGADVGSYLVATALAQRLERGLRGAGGAQEGTDVEA